MFREILKGVKVVDFTHVGAGPMATMLLGDMGADIIKVEPPGGELGRKLGPGWIGEDCTAYYGFNRNKRSISLNLKDTRGVSIARKLIEEADVVIESLRPGVMRKLGLDYDTIKTWNPKVIYCAISAYGQTGPYASRPGVDGILQADSGLMSVIGSKNVQEPCKVQAPVVDVTTGYIASMAILAELFDRERGAAGGFIDVNLLNSALVLQQTSLTNYFSEKTLPQKMGSAAPYSAPNEAFQTKDGWIMVAAYNGTRWADLCGVLGLDPLIDDQRFKTSADRVRHRDAMQAALTTVFETHATAYWVEKLLAADILCAKVSTYDDLQSHPQVQKNNMVTSFVHPLHGAIQTIGFPVNSSETNQHAHALPPGCGEHTTQILADHGYSQEEISSLRAQAVVG